jgi:thiamine-phosphate pyrophosphorylase
MDESAVQRILDANANRAREGLRVVEAFVRFAWDDPVLSAEAKRLRHALTDALGADRIAGNLLARDTGGDVGTTIRTAAEDHRADAADVATAAFKRVAEALRVLAEYGKAVGVGAERIERLRYELYELETAFTRRLVPRPRLERMRLYVILTTAVSARPLVEAAEAVLAGGADCVQLREKQMPDGELLALARRVGALCRRAGRLFIVNDRPDIAKLAGADGVHVGQEDLPIAAARRIVGPRALVGRSCQTVEHARAAVRDGADYVGVGPLFASPTKPRDVIPGPALMRRVAAEIRIPHVAIAGINRRTLAAAQAAGARCCAICSAILGSDDVAAETRWFAERLAEEGRGAQEGT